MKDFQWLLQTFLIDYLPKRRGFSPHTIAAYRKRDLMSSDATWKPGLEALGSGQKR